MTTAAAPLDDWLHRLETFSPHEIDLGLARVRAVLDRMECSYPDRVIHVAGTNGKGSSVALLQSLLSSSGTTGTYTSPHIIHYNERIRVDDVPASDEQIVAAFERVEAARRDTPLTYFEFGTLAALIVFDVSGVDTAILEVGMGGRLDAVNAIEPDAGLITNVSLDHCEWLGNDIETIAREKAGIMRSGKPVIYADPAMPKSIGLCAHDTNASLIRAGEDYSWQTDEDGQWSWQGNRIDLSGLGPLSLPGAMQVQNAAGVLALVEAIGLDELLKPGVVNSALGSVTLPARAQNIRRNHQWIIDVAHNPAAAKALASVLRESVAEQTVAVIGMLDDKDVEGVVAALDPLVDSWIATNVESARGIDAGELARRVANQANRSCLVAESLDDALDDARNFAGADRPILVTGSFYLVGPVLERFGPDD